MDKSRYPPLAANGNDPVEVMGPIRPGVGAAPVNRSAGASLAGAVTASRHRAESRRALKEIIVYGVVGMVMGAGIGAMAQLALVTVNVTLFAASPVIAPLVMIGWGASLGALLGSLAGARDEEGWFATQVGRAIARRQGGRVVPVVPRVRWVSPR